MIYNFKNDTLFFERSLDRKSVKIHSILVFILRGSQVMLSLKYRIFFIRQTRRTILKKRQHSSTAEAVSPAVNPNQIPAAFKS